MWLNPSNISPTDFISELSQRCKDQYRQAWESEMKASSGKLRTYRLFKKEFCSEAYLNLPPYLRVPIAKLRTSAHPLRIETGRYALPTPLPVKERTCWYCTNLVEDEVHFLITCELYQNSNERVRLFDRCSTLNPAFPHMSDTDKMSFIFQSKDHSVLKLLGYYVIYALNVRHNVLQSTA